MASDAWTRYKLQRKLFAIGEDFWIENDKGEQVYKVDGKALSIRKKFILEDQAGGELLSVEAKLIALQPTMKIERQGQLYATVTKALFTLFHQHYTPSHFALARSSTRSTFSGRCQRPHFR